MTKLLDKAIRKVQNLPKGQQDSIAAMILEELEDAETTAAYDRAKAEGGDPVPFEDVVRDIESDREKESRE